jgi:polyphenol oxidase
LKDLELRHARTLDSNKLLQCSSQRAQQTRGAEAVRVIRVPGWAGSEWLLHGFSTRMGGLSRIAGFDELNLGFGVDHPETVAANRRLFLQTITAPGEGIEARSMEHRRLVTLKQMHSSLVRRVGLSDAAERASLWGDGLITNEPGVLLGIQTADCLPILVVDQVRRAVAAFHAGWRGTLKRIVEKGIRELEQEFGSEPEGLLAAIGPGIGSCCFAVGAEVRELFRGQFSYADELFARQPQLHLDLAEANRRQLLAAGLLPESIFLTRECTSCHIDRFFSYRAERGKTGRMMAVIGIAA